MSPWASNALAARNFRHLPTSLFDSAEKCNNSKGRGNRELIIGSEAFNYQMALARETMSTAVFDL